MDAPDRAAPDAARSSRQVLVAIAASDGLGIGAVDPDRDNWVSQLGRHLPGDTRVVNLGISGATAAQAAAQELPVALDAGATLIAIWLGVNDFQQRVSLPVFSANLDRILLAIHRSGVARAFVGNLPDLRLLPAFVGRDAVVLDAEVSSWNAEIARVVQLNGAHLVDIYGAWGATRDRASLVSGDGFHPNSAGYARLADLFWQAIKGDE